MILACSVAVTVAASAYGIDHRTLLGAQASRLHLTHPVQSIASLPPARPHNRQPVSITALERRAAVAELRSKHIGLPIKNANVEKMKGSFYELRGAEMHEAVDILQPRNTPVLAVENGVVAKLFTSRFGGLTIYEFDPTKKYVYYYAHLQKYADDIHDGDVLKKGQVIGFVGTSGNAPPNCPHLHFSIALLGKDAKWWQAAAVDPYEVFSGR